MIWSLFRNHDSCWRRHHTGRTYRNCIPGGLTNLPKEVSCLNKITYILLVFELQMYQKKNLWHFYEMNLHIPIILLFIQRHNVSVSFRRRQQQKKRNVRESNALLEPANPYSDRESAGVTYKMMELRHAGAIPPDMTSDIQAIELCAGPQCTACSLSQGFPCDPRDRNMYEVPTFKTIKMQCAPSGPQIGLQGYLQIRNSHHLQLKCTKTVNMSWTSVVFWI